MAKAAVLISGCGRMDGSEIHESTLALLYLAQHGIDYQCFAPDEPQVRVTNHITGDDMDERRNQMIEASRIARGDIQPMSEANARGFDALVMPGGNGGFLNLSQGPDGIRPDVKQLIVDFNDAGKPIVAICIAPMLVARALGDRGVRLTIGDDRETARKIEETGAKHLSCSVYNCVADENNLVVSTPAYMLGPGIYDVSCGIQAAMDKLEEWLR